MMCDAIHVNHYMALEIREQHDNGIVNERSQQQLVMIIINIQMAPGDGTIHA